MTTIIYSAYNAAPSGLADDYEAEDLWYKVLRAEQRIGGLELPAMPGGLHPEGPDRLARLLDPGWSNTVSAMPMTLMASKSDPAYGLASVDSAGRARAVADLASALDQTLRLQTMLGPTSVRAFAIQPAPHADNASVGAFTDSLQHIAGWDWGSIELLVEHSDALIPGQAPQKGYLALDDEMASVRSVLPAGGVRIRHLLNWGRSAIEGRSATTPLDHVSVLGPGLGAFAFSGAGPTATSRSTAWEDVHLGLASEEAGSLLTAAGVREVVAKLPDGLSYLGIKAGAPYGSQGPERLRLGLGLLAALTDGGLSAPGP